MSTYVFKSVKDPDNKFEVSNITFEIEAVNRQELIEEFIRFLGANGYHVKDLEELLME